MYEAFDSAEITPVDTPKQEVVSDFEEMEE